MTETSTTDPAVPDSAPVSAPSGQSLARNEVLLCGRVSAAPEERDLPSGASIVTSRLVVDRDAAARKRSSQRVDTFDLVAWTARAQRTMRSWAPGDVVTVEGAVRRRFYRGPTGPVSRVEVEVRSARKVRGRPAPS
jgi:single-strand DNA-binding protein